MNFANVPELNWHYGNLWATGLMIITSVILVGLFRRHGWF
jgi:Mg2+ and Co2+ transporter CorA